MGWLRRGTQTGATGPRITLIDRAGCHLCEEATVVVERVAARSGAGWARLDVDSSPDLVEQYAELVPVILVDGQQVAHWSVTEDVLTRALRRRGRWPGHTRR